MNIHFYTRMTEQSGTERVAPTPTSLESHYKLPRSLCSGANPADHIWCSKGMVISPENVAYMQQMCLSTWSPGMVIYAATKCISETTLVEMMDVLEKTARQLGRARRITLGFNPSKEMVTRLYKCFYCVESVNSEGVPEVLGDESENQQDRSDRVQ